ncbi:DUF86 domain-containing protein [bacterium]|nr:DUF86 domain-containing protein [bacterium]
MKLPPIDEEKVTKLIREIQESVERLKGLKRLSLEEFLSDKDNYAICEHYLRRALEGVLSLATHILSRLPIEKPKDYTETLIKLGEAKVIPFEFAQKIKGMAGYRNRLVHLYWEVTSEEIYENFKKLKILKNFLSTY